MKKSIVCLWLMIFCVCSFFPMRTSQSYAKESDSKIELTAKSALLMDFDSETVIYEKNAHERLPIASMTKLATLAVVFDFLDKGIIKENDLISVSENAADVGGSSAFLDAGSNYKLSELVKSVIIASANDSSVALAETVAGSEDVFVSKMNKKVEELKLQDTKFANCTGLPAEGHYSSAYDMAKIYKQVCDHELYKKYAKVWMDDFVHPSGRTTGLVNTNRLVKTFEGVEGGKTGYTDSAKFCLTASAKRGETRFVAVVIGVSDSKTRFAETSKLLNYGFANYKNNVIVRKDVPVTIETFKNAKYPIEIYAKKNVSKLIEKTDENYYSTDFQVSEMKAPLKKGDVVGKMFVFDKNNMVVDEIDLIAGKDVESVGLKENFKKIVVSW